MGTQQNQDSTKSAPYIEEHLIACDCGSRKVYIVHRINTPSGKVSTMYECVACGEYRL